MEFSFLPGFFFFFSFSRLTSVETVTDSLRNAVGAKE